jgi:carboxylesterase type B
VKPVSAFHSIHYTFSGKTNESKVTRFATLPIYIGLFHRAISQSGNVLNAWLYSRYPKQQAKALAEKVSCPTESSQEMVKCLKNVNAKDIVSTHREMRVRDILSQKST